MAWTINPQASEGQSHVVALAFAAILEGSVTVTAPGPPLQLLRMLLTSSTFAGVRLHPTGTSGMPAPLQDVQYVAPPALYQMVKRLADATDADTFARVWNEEQELQAMLLWQGGAPSFAEKGEVIERLAR